MRRSVINVTFASVLLGCLLAHTAFAADDDPCKRFTWDVSHELEVMKQSPQNVGVGTKAGSKLPELQIDKLYSLALVPQSAITFAAKPAKPTLDDGENGGLAAFHVTTAGHYRVAITSGHWIDVVSAGQVIKSLDFQGARGCERPHKIVEFDLPANSDLTLQLSGGADASVIVAITAVRPLVSR
jgi:hypothetical protein